jgi:hypothetical protein
MRDDYCGLVWYDTLGHQCRRRGGDHSRHECPCGTFWQNSRTLPVFGPASEIERVSGLIGARNGDVYQAMSDRDHIDASDAGPTSYHDHARRHPRSNQVQLPGSARFVPPRGESKRSTQ